MILVEGANSYLSETLEDQANRKILEGAARTVFGQEFRIRYEFERKKNDKRGEGKRASVEEKSTDFHPISPSMPSAPANSLLEQGPGGIRGPGGQEGIRQSIKRGRYP